jgi:hypothetical protein
LPGAYEGAQYGARVFPSSVIDSWGSTTDERAESYPCDDLVEGTRRELFRAVDVDAPAAVAFRWVCQLRAAPYSYDLLDNLGRRSPRELTPGLDDLAVGQRVMTIFRLRAFEPGRSITADSETRLFGYLAVTYLVVPVDDHRSRLVAKLVGPPRSGCLAWVMDRVLPAGDLVMMRKQLLTLKSLAERAAH